MKLRNMIPFMDEEDIDELVESVINGEVTDVSFEELLPFASEECVEKLFKNALNNGSFPGNAMSKSKIYSMLPFMSDEALHALVVSYTEGKIAELPDAIVPFLDSADVKLLMRYELSKNKKG